MKLRVNCFHFRRKGNSSLQKSTNIIKLNIQSIRDVIKNRQRLHTENKQNDWWERKGILFLIHSYDQMFPRDWYLFRWTSTTFWSHSRNMFWKWKSLQWTEWSYHKIFEIFSYSGFGVLAVKLLLDCEQRDWDKILWDAISD